jgi:hypothetical protein
VSQWILVPFRSNAEGALGGLSRRAAFYLRAVKRRQQKRKRVRRAQHARATCTPDRPGLLISSSGRRTKSAHIVPRTYQKAWEGDERQVAVHVKGGTGCELKSTKLVAVRGPYYRRTRPSGVPTDDIEDSLAHVENKATPALREVREGLPLTVERKGALAQLFGVQMMRGPAFFAKHEEIHRSVLEGARASGLKPRHLAAAGGDVELVRSQVIDVLLTPTYRFMTMLAYAAKVAGILSLMRWHVLRFKEPLLAYSDHPVVLWPMNVERTLPFRRQGLGPLTMLEIRVPIAPDAAILMNWIDRSDEVGIPMKRRAAGEINAFTVSQTDREWMHKPGGEPEIPDDVFSPLSRLVDFSYDCAAAERSVRRAYASNFQQRASKRQWVNELDVVVEIDSPPGLRVAA